MPFGITTPARWEFKLIYLFEDFALDPDRRELRRCGDPVAVEPSVFDLLLYLVQNRHRVVSKDSLIADVWKRRIVSESTLTSRMNGARNVVGDNGTQQRLIRTIARKGHRFVGEVREVQGPQPTSTQNVLAATKSGPTESGTPIVSFVKAADDTNLAVAKSGKGPPLLRAAHWYTHIEHEWQSPLTCPLLRRLAECSSLVFYDGRGAGLSDRNVADMSFDSYLGDLEAVADNMMPARFALMGMSGGAATAMAYAARHPHRISKLVLFGGYALGRNRRRSPQTAEEAKAFLTMIRSAWNDVQSPFWRAFSSFFLPNATAEQFAWFSNLHSVALSMESGIKARVAVDEIDVHEMLARVKAPTLILHCLRDKLIPFEQGRLLATSIPNARLVPLDSENHTLLSSEPAWETLVREIEAFLRTSD
ncbi:MAG: alpha/beta fold hydrolase [Rhizomicrobium sp.]